MSKININFKVDEETKNMLDQLVVFKTVSENKKSSQHAVFLEGIYDLFLKYTKKFENKKD